MVFLSYVNFARCKGPDEFWRKRRIFQLTAHLRGRRWNCYKLAIRGVHRILRFCTRGRALKKEQLSILWNKRIEAACEEHGLDLRVMKEGMSRSDILVNRKTLSTLAMWEPRTFKCLSTIALARTKADGVRFSGEMLMPNGIIDRGMYRKKIN